MTSRITGANTGQWVRLFNDLARNQKRRHKMPLQLAGTITTPEASTGQWVILVTLEAESSEVTMIGTIFLGGTARRKSSGARVQEARFAGACQDQHAGRPAPSLGWPGESKSIGATSRGKRRFSKISWWVKGNQSVQQAKVTGLGAGLGPRPPERLGPGHLARNQKRRQKMPL